MPSSWAVEPQVQPEQAQASSAHRPPLYPDSGEDCIEARRGVQPEFVASETLLLPWGGHCAGDTRFRFVS